MLTIKLFGFKVNFHLTILILVLFMLDTAMSVLGIALWVLAVLTSVVLHELGHAFAVRRFGGHVQSISIHALGGMTVWQEIDTPMQGWRRFVVAAAGSGVGLVIGLVLYAIVSIGGFGRLATRIIPSLISPPAWVHADAVGQYLTLFVGVFIWVSVLWGLVNWLPIGGLDGSKMLQEVFVSLFGERGDLYARIVGVVVAIAASYLFWRWGFYLAPVFFILFAFSDVANYRRKRQVQARTEPAPDQSAQAPGFPTEEDAQ